MAAYTQYLCSLKVRNDCGCSQSHSLMVSSQEALRNLVRCFVFQFNETTCCITQTNIQQEQQDCCGSDLGTAVHPDQAVKMSHAMCRMLHVSAHLSAVLAPATQGISLRWRLRVPELDAAVA